MSHKEKVINGIKGWFPLYAAKWITSQNLRVCSLLAKGLYMELMVWSWYEGTPGEIKINVPVQSLLFKCTEAEYEVALAELEKFKVIVIINGIVVIEKLQQIAQEQRDKFAKIVERGSKGGKKKAENRIVNKKGLDE